MKNLNLNLFLMIGLIGLFIFIAWGVTYSNLKNIEGQLLASIAQIEKLSLKNESSYLKNFAQCLTQKGIRLYGSSQDIYTQKQKAMFGRAINYLTYIECIEPESKELLFECQVEAIKTFPTWEFPDKERKSGILSLEELEELSNCQI
ncbi:MAG: hypothetical protein QME57_01775 [Patescibacteria group bacterium]|nr:hypothetical protein [Patescibacteria group bacterium]